MLETRGAAASIGRHRSGPCAQLWWLHLYGLPWMHPELADEQYDLPWEQQFEHPIYIAWRLRREARRQEC
jgi:hypothetical protein